MPQVGGVMEQLWPLDQTARYDSWLAVGSVDGTAAEEAITSTGIDFGAWDEEHQLHVTDGGLAWTNTRDPAMPPPAAGSSVVIAQLTVPTEAHLTARVNAEGYTLTGIRAPTSDQARYEVYDIRFDI
eukprot:SAG31_NODE_4904_length_2876_cov_3.048614_2_plen_127_part_00